MQFLTIFTTLLIAALGSNAAPSIEVLQEPNIAGTVDFFNSPGCTQASCRPGVPVFNGSCITVDQGCALAGVVRTLQPGCFITLWTDATCTSLNNRINITDAPSQCQQPGPLIGSVSGGCP